ncbi:MAG TPA: amidohydrolase family protein, partial [Vicinamibacteria bacterium]
PPQALTPLGAYYREPVFTPAGTQVVALRGSRRVRVEREDEWGGLPPGMDVIAVPAEGGEARVVVPTRGASRPHFTHEKDRLFLYSPEGLVSLRLDGSDRRTVVKLVGKGPGPEPPPAQGAVLSPDGRHAMAHVNQQLYLTAVPRVGGETPTLNVQSPSVAARKLTELGADSFAFADGGKTLTWSLGASFYRQALASVELEAPDEDEKKEAKGEEEKDKNKNKKPAYEEISVEITAPRARPRGSVVLRGARIITMKGDEVVPQGDILVTDDRIVALGPTGSVKVPTGAREIDLAGKTVIPGIIDTHAHWSEVRHGVLDVQAWTFLANLAYGVTAGRDPQTMTNDMFAYQDLIEAGEMLGPRAFSTGPGVFSDTDFQSLDEAKSAVAKYKKHYRTNTLKSYVVGNRKQRQFVVEACKEHGIMPTTEGALDLKLDLTHVLDGFAGNEHALPIVPLFRDVTELVARSGISYTPTLLVAYGGPAAEHYFYETTEVHDDPKLRRFMPAHLLHAKSARRPWFRKQEHVFPQLAASAAKIVRAGGRVCVGGHGQLQGIQVHWEMWALESGGLTPHEVLRAATLNGAQAIGYAQDLGSLEAGKLADLVVLDADPLADLRNTARIRYVMKNGELFDGSTLDQVWPAAKPLGRLWWWDDEPPKGAR